MSLQPVAQRQGIEVRLLHSQFLPADRGRIEGEIVAHFGEKGDKSGRWIVVATQAIEVGLDITCQEMHTEVAPANAILQRAGRCARYRGQTGDVYIYSQARDKDGDLLDLREKTLPYGGTGQVQTRRTWNELYSLDGQALRFSQEQALVQAVHGEADRAAVKGLTAGQATHRERMHRVMDGERNSGEAADLIRQVSSRRVIVHDDPDLVAGQPFAYESFSLFSGSVSKLVDEWRERAQSEGLENWGVWGLFDGGDKDENGRSVYAWLPAIDKTVAERSAAIMVDPLLAGYTSLLGFVPDRGTGYASRLIASSAEEERQAYGYRLETYEEHVRRVYDAMGEIWGQFAYPAGRLEGVAGWPENTLERAALLVALLHDVGKLTRGWQDWVVRYQQTIGRPVAGGQCYAHTDRDPADESHRRAEKAAGARPPHAGEGAFAAAEMLGAILGDHEPVFRAALTAIARHHGPFTKDCKVFRLAPDSGEAVGRTAAYLPRRPQAVSQRNETPSPDGDSAV